MCKFEHREFVCLLSWPSKVVPERRLPEMQHGEFQHRELLDVRDSTVDAGIAVNVILKDIVRKLGQVRINSQ